MLEYLNYIKDYNDLLVFEKYLKYEVEKSEIKSFSTEKYTVEIDYNNQEIYYIITMNRWSFFCFDNFKIIKYDGIV